MSDTTERVIVERFIGWTDGALAPRDVVAVLAWIHASGWTVRRNGTWQGAACLYLDRERRRRRLPFPEPSGGTDPAEWAHVEGQLVA